MRRLVGSCFVYLLIAGCGSSSGGGGSSGFVEFLVFKGAIQAPPNVAVYILRNTGATGRMLWSGQTDANGRFRADITGYTGPADNLRPITARRSVNSSVTVRAGETLGLGGLLKEVEHKTIKRLPLLGNIPVLGRLFQHHTTSTEKTDLLILITPTLLTDS